MEFVSFGSLGNSADFGDLTVARENLSADGNSTRGIFGSGATSPGRSDVIDYITMASAGNAIDFGNLAATIQIHNGASSNCHSGLEAFDPDERFLISNIVGSGKA